MTEGDEPGGRDPSAWERLRSLPDLDAAPLEADWLAPPSTDRLAPPPRPERASPPTPDNPVDPRVDQRRFRVGTVGAPPQPMPSPAPSPPDRPTPEPPTPLVEEPERHRGPERRRRRGPWIAAVVAIPILLIATGWLYAWVQWSRIERVDTDGALTSAGGFTNYLIVGVDSREGVDAGLATAGSIGLGVEGSRSDTMVVLHLGDDGDNRMMSLPRDLWVDIDGGGQDKLNAATVFGGPPTLIRTVEGALDLPVHRYLEVDIAGFLEVVDALGSITIDFPSAACDPKSGLMIRRRGEVRLGPERALAYVRSRTYTEFDPRRVDRNATCADIMAAGLGSTSGTADIGRTERQRRFLLAVFDEIGSTDNPVTLLSVFGGLTGGLRVDDEMSMLDALSLARRLRGFDAENVTLPVVDFNPGSTLALALGADAQRVLDGFR